MPSKTAKSSTASSKSKGKGSQPRDDSEDELDVPPPQTKSNGQEEAPPTTDASQGEAAEAADYRSLEEILGSIPPPPPPAMTNEPGAPRLMITHLVNRNFKSYSGEQILGPFHKRFSCIIGPNGSGKSNVIDSMLFVFGYRAQKIRSKKLSVLIHSSDQHKDVQSCTVEVHFQKIIDKEGDDYEVIPNSKFYVSRTANKDSSSAYHIGDKKATFKEVGVLLRSHGIDLDHNRFLILQGEVEQIAMMKPKGQTEHDEGMLEYLEDIIGSCRLKQPILTLARRIELLNEQRGEKLNRVKLVEKEKNALEGEKNKAVDFLTLENDIFKHKSRLCQYYVDDLQKRAVDKDQEKQRIMEDTKELTEKNAKISEEMEKMNQELKNVEKKQNKLNKYIETQKEKFTQLDLQDVEVREKIKHSKSKNKKVQKQLEKDKEKLEEVRGVPASSEKAISEATARKEEMEKQKVKEEKKLEEVMESLKEETSGLQQDKETKEKELMELSKAVNETQSRMDLAQSELDIYLSRHNTALTQLNTAKQTLQTTSDTLRERRAAIKDLEVKIPQKEQELKKDAEALEQLMKTDNETREVVREMRQKVDEAKSSLTSNRSRGRVLDALMQQKKSGRIPGIFGRLGDLGAIEEKYDVAISSSCGALDNIVVDTIDTAQKCVMFLKEQNIGFATFIGLDKMKVWERNMAPIRTPEETPRLFDMVRVKEESVRPAFYFALRDTLVAQDMEQATRMAFQKDKRWRVVTLKGQIIEMAGTMTGGGRAMKGRMGSSLGTEVSQEELNRMESQLTEKVSKLQNCQEKRLQLEESVQRLRILLRDMKNTLEKYSNSMTSLADQETHLKLQMKELEANVLAAAPDKARQKQLEKSLGAFKKDFDAASSKAGKVETEVKRLHTLIVDINSHKLKAQQDKLDKISKELDDCSSIITKAKVAIKTADRNLKKCEESVSREQAELEDNEKSMAELTEQLKKLEDEAGDVMKACQEAEAALPEVQGQYQAVVKEIKVLQQQEHAMQQESLSVRLRIEQIDTTITEHNNKIKHWQKEATKLSLHTVEGQPAEELPVLTSAQLEEIPNPNVIINKMITLETKCAHMKPNLGAIAEYKKKEELYLQRVAQLDQITTERDRFKHGYEDLRKQRLNEFMTGFNIITNKLKENYQMLTLGGDAELELVDSLDPFSEGIMFSVRPPKKSWKKIFNLSGGEKTLSSLALVFALHHYKPTPLYFMDEIDAALDFKNVSIVACYIYEQTKNAQFIIISLRNNMFEIADRLIGIYKTHNTTKSVGINPKTVVFKEHDAVTA
ncbi:structural maintenance of chromosomes protein 4 isoform X1 [Pseudochaenichthys georgianus]|uniref:structural maintenance of chromosomes protein 4 isoform X1 n=2 Tax=Pseudochaenichthys georgianus TaxID=52239 RepID=UPI00146CC548|nr:structural maintenance of chromosomes protein 4 isoform X1 [Pseudochaenichthys georgianus]XP_033953367.1 structural maintenance of chromosomes protein 4 isoform X1 [Pseudochaenichthys georgianus]